jgi:hypothetical protein
MCAGKSFGKSGVHANFPSTYNQYPGQKSWSFRFRKTTSGEAFLYPGIKISLLFMLPAPQHAPSAYNWLPGNIHDLNMIRKVVPCCIEITTLVYPIAVDTSSLQKIDWIHHFPDRQLGKLRHAFLPICRFFEIPWPFCCQKRNNISVDATNIA